MAGTIVAGTISDGTDISPVTDVVKGSARAWVTFNGTLVTGTADLTGVRASYNVSSVVDNGVGDYTINFTTAIEDINYGISGFFSVSGATSAGSVFGGANFSQLTTSLRIQTGTTALVDPTTVCVTIFR